MSRHLTCCLGLSSILMLAGAPASALAQLVHVTPAGGVPPSRLAADLDRLRVEIAALGNAADAAALAGRIPPVWRVLDGDARVDVGAGWLIAALKEAPAKPDAWPGMRTSLLRRLTSVRDEVAAAHDVNGPQTRAQARSAVESILARNEFQQSAASRFREQLQERVGRWFEDLWARFGGVRGTARDTALVLAWAAVLAALLGVGFWLARTIADRPRGAALSLGAGLAARPRARELALLALSAARQGQTREAVRYAYGAALVRLAEEGVWRVDDARTPREYLPMLPATDSRYSVMIDLTRRFEQIWYGNRAVVADDARRMTDHLEALGCLRPGERAT